MNRRAAAVGAILVAVVMLCPPSSSLLTVASPQEEDLGVLTSLRWLARHQDPDGHWGVTSYVKQCKKGDACAPSPGDERYDTAVTGLSLLAFLGAGYYHGSKDTYDGIHFGDVVRNGLKRLVNLQRINGAIDVNKPVNMYNHLLPGLALTEAYGFSPSEIFKEPPQKAVDFAVAAQNDDGGWGYEPKDGKSNSAVTIWGIMLLKSAELSGLDFPEEKMEKAAQFFAKATDDDGRTGYGAVTSRHASRHGGYKISIPNALRQSNEAMTAAMIISAIFIVKKEDDRVISGLRLLVKDPPRWDDREIDFHYWCLARTAIFQYDGPRGEQWKKWNVPTKDALIKHRNRKISGCRSGSWEPIDRWSPVGGRIYATAINALSLEFYYHP